MPFGHRINAIKLRRAAGCRWMPRTSPNGLRKPHASPRRDRGRRRHGWARLAFGTCQHRMPSRAPPSRGGPRGAGGRCSLWLPLRHSHRPGGQPLPLPPGDPQVPDAHRRGGARPRQALEGRGRRAGRAQARHLAPAPRRQDRHGLPRLRPAGRRADLRRQRRHDAGGEAVRPGPRLPPGDLRHVVDPRRHPGIHPAQLVAGEDGHDGRAEEAVLQPAPAEGPDGRAGGRRPPAGAGGEDRQGAARCRSRTWSA